MPNDSNENKIDYNNLVDVFDERFDRKLCYRKELLRQNSIYTDKSLFDSFIFSRFYDKILHINSLKEIDRLSQFSILMHSIKNFRTTLYYYPYFDFRIENFQNHLLLTIIALPNFHWPLRDIRIKIQQDEFIPVTISYFPRIQFSPIDESAYSYEYQVPYSNILQTRETILGIIKRRLDDNKFEIWLNDIRKYLYNHD